MEPRPPHPSATMKGRNSALHYVYQILNAGADSARHSDLEVHTRLFRDGRQMYEGKPMPLETVSQRDPKRLVAAGAMKLSAQMQPGDYVLQVIAIDQLSGDKHHTATQSTDFEVEH